ncbi:hypothetical protein [Pseudoalteromonas sp. APC 3691]|uniref:hypothetical protein n=1 Tax=Pseudoalteromonas sp. APC 3691 TaxID=3035173 RepID=UPI0025B5997D|nr:hypothetical protein [Pseudoalteromonas sp. APC 3691]MDN3390856.1 hypothetical protein [Pseudoalteromonas sp. APC 3691]
MPVITIKTFGGEIPKLDPRLLPNEAATKAFGCHFDNGNLSPLKEHLEIAAPVPDDTKTIYLHENEYWFSWSVDVNAVASPVASDPWSRVYFTGDGYPKVTNNTIFQGTNMPASAYKLGIQAPEVPIIGVVSESAPEDEDLRADPNDDETRYYTHTFVTEQGEEGPPGEASNAIEIKYPDEEGTFVTLSFSPPNTNSSNITSRRIYRTATGGGVADYLFVAEILISQDLFVDDFNTSELGASLDTYDYEMPNENMIGLTTMANGILAGFFDSTVCFSEAYLPYAWPTGYQQTTEHEIVTVKALGNTLAVLTKGYPYLFSGITPSSMTGQKLEFTQSCSSKRSAVIIEGAIIYASPDGLVSLSTNGMQILTSSVITKEQWKYFKPETIEAYHQEGKYLAFYGEDLNKGFIFNPKTGDFRHFTNTAKYGFNNLEDDNLYIGSGGAVFRWEGGIEPVSYEWRSKEYQSNDFSFSCALVRGVNLDKCGLIVYADNEAVLNIGIGDMPSAAFRLPQARGDSWAVEIFGKGVIHTVTLSTTMREVVS